MAFSDDIDLDAARAKGLGERSPDTEPTPLNDDLLPVPPFDLDMLPEAIQPWIADIAERMQVPLDFPAVAAVVAIGGIIGRRIGIKPKEHDSWTVAPNLWGGLVGRPSAMKSPTMSEAFKYVREMENREAKKHAEAMETYEKDFEFFELKKKVAIENAKRTMKDAIGNGRNPDAEDYSCLDIPEPQRPVCKRYLLTDATYEKAGSVMSENPDGVTVLVDELVGFLRPLSRREYASARSFWLTAWNGLDEYTFDRIGRGTIVTPCTASIFGGVQPAKLAEYLRQAINGGDEDDGLMQRFQLLVYPDASTSWEDVDRTPNVAARDDYQQLFERLSALDPATIGAQVDDAGDVPTLRFSPEAQQYFREWRKVHERQLREGGLHPALESHFAKYRSLVPSLALIFHLIDCPLGDPVSAVATLRALSWTDYLAAHARRIYGSVTLPERTGARQIWDRLKAGDLPTTFKVRTIQQKCWAGLGDAKAIRAALEVLTSHNLVLATEVPASQTGGRPAEEYRMNPKAEGPP
jgi:hypothetical protein